MKFCDLVKLNKSWYFDTQIFVLNASSCLAESFSVRTAVSLYGDAEVMYFRGDVVALM